MQHYPDRGTEAVNTVLSDHRPGIGNRRPQTSCSRRSALKGMVA